MLILTSCDKEDMAMLTGGDNQIILENTDPSSLEDSKSTAANFVPTSALTQDEIDGLLWMREEEKLAHDVYVLFYADYGLNIFNKISFMICFEFE